MFRLKTALILAYIVLLIAAAACLPTSSGPLEVQEPQEDLPTVVATLRPTATAIPTFTPVPTPTPEPTPAPTATRVVLKTLPLPTLSIPTPTVPPTPVELNQNPTPRPGLPPTPMLGEDTIDEDCIRQGRARIKMAANVLMIQLAPGQKPGETFPSIAREHGGIIRKMATNSPTGIIEFKCPEGDRGKARAELKKIAEAIRADPRTALVSDIPLELLGRE